MSDRSSLVSEENIIVIGLLSDLPANVLGAEASRKLTNEDYEQVLIPAPH